MYTVLENHKPNGSHLAFNVSSWQALGSSAIDRKIKGHFLSRAQIETYFGDIGSGPQALPGTNTSDIHWCDMGVWRREGRLCLQWLLMPLSGRD